MRLTHKHAAAGGRVVHALQGGGRGLRDRNGKPRYLAGVTWCGLHLRGKYPDLVETDAEVTCKTCIAAMSAFALRRRRREEAGDDGE